MPQRPIQKPVDPEMEELDRKYGLQPPSGQDPAMAELDQMYGQAPAPPMVPNPRGRPAPVEEPSQMGAFGSEFWRRLNEPVLPEVHREEGTWDPNSLASKADFFAKEMGKNTYEMARGMTTPGNILLGLATGGTAMAGRTLGPAARGIGKGIAAGFAGYEGAQAAKSLGEFVADPSLEKAAPVAQHTGFALLGGVGAHAIGRNRPGGPAWDKSRIKDVARLIDDPVVDSASLRSMKRIISEDPTLPPELQKYLIGKLDQADFGLQTGAGVPPGGEPPPGQMILRPPEAGQPTPTMGPFPGPADILTGKGAPKPKPPTFEEAARAEEVAWEAARSPESVADDALLRRLLRGEELAPAERRSVDRRHEARFGPERRKDEGQGMPKEARSPEAPATATTQEPLIPGMPRPAEPAVPQQAPDPFGFAGLQAELEAGRKAPGGSSPIVENQRKRLFAIAGEKKLTKLDLQEIAGKRVSSLTVEEANVLADRIQSITPEEIAGIRQKRELPLIDKAEAQTPKGALELFNIKPEPKPKVIVKGLRKEATHDPGQSIVSVIMHLGGIKRDAVTRVRGTTKKGRPIRTMDEEWATLPADIKSSIFRKNPHASGPDDLVDQLNGMGWNIRDDNHLREILGKKDVRKKSLDGPSDKEMGASQAKWLDEQMEADALRSQTPDPDTEFEFGANVPEVLKPRTQQEAQGNLDTFIDDIRKRHGEGAEVRAQLGPEFYDSLGLPRPVNPIDPKDAQRLRDLTQERDNFALEQMDEGAPHQESGAIDIEARDVTELPEVFRLGRDRQLTAGTPEPPKIVETPTMRADARTADARAKKVAEQKAAAEKLQKPKPVQEFADEMADIEGKRRESTEAEYQRQILTNPDTGNRRVALGLEKQKAKPEVRGPLFGKEEKPKTEKKAQKSIFGPEDGFIDLSSFAKDLLRSDDPATQKIFDRLNEKRKAAKDKTPPERAIPNPGEPDVPRGITAVGAAIRPLDLVLERIPATRKITDEIKYKAHWEGTKAVEQWIRKANKIIKSSKIKPDSPEDYALTSLLDSASTKFTPEKLREQAAAGAFPGNAENVINAYNQFRETWFDPIQRTLNDPKVLDSVGTTGYISGYFPHIHSREFARFGKENAIAMMRDFLPEEMRPGRFRAREKNAPGYEMSIFKVITPYLSSWKRMKYDIPAYDRSIKIVETLPEGSIRRAAKWYADNYIGQPSSKNIATANESYMKASKFIADRVYDSAIGLNLPTWALNMTQAATHTWPKLGKHAKGGLADLMTAAGRDKFHRSGLLMDFAMLEGTKPKGKARRVLHAGMEGTEYFNRGVAYLGGLRQAKEIGLVGAAAQKHAYSVVGETNFFYSKVSPIWALEQAGPMGKTFATFPLKTADMAIEIFKGGRKDPARLTRFLLVTAGTAGILKASGVDAQDIERWSLGLSDVVPGLAPLPKDLLVDLPKFLYQVGLGKKSYSDIPEAFLKYLDRRFTPARKLTHSVVGAVAQ